MLEEIPRIIFALIAVLAMIGGGAMLARRIGLVAPTASLGRKKRISLVESMAIDARRRVAIIKCDNTEHLVLFGATGETVIAHDIEGSSEQTTSENADETMSPQGALSPLSALTKALGQDAKKIA